MKKGIISKLLTALLVVGLLFSILPSQQAAAATTEVVCTGTGDAAMLQSAIVAAADGDIISVTGTCVLESEITISKAITLDGGNRSATIKVSGTGNRIVMTTAGATLTGFDIEKTDKTGEQNILWAHASNLTISNNKFHGQYAFGDSQVSRAMVVSAGHSGLLIEGNEFVALRQPAYVNGPVYGIVRNNLTKGTRGWVLDTGGGLEWTGNTWGTGTDANVYDIAILSGMDAVAYPDIVALSAANNNAVIEDQRGGTAVLNSVYVDAAAAAGGIGTQAAPLQTIQAGIDRVTPGGTVNVAEGEYNVPATINLNKAISIVGPTTGEAKVIGAGGVDLSIFNIASSNVTIQNLTLTLASAPGSHTAMITSPDMAHSNIKILNNKIYVEPQAGGMGNWYGQAVWLGRHHTAAKINGNTVYNLRGGIIAHYDNEVEIKDNLIYNTKGGIQNYTNTDVDAARRVMSGNSWSTVHNEWDIVWNSGSNASMDLATFILPVSAANNDAYVVSQAIGEPKLHNRSHVFVNVATGTDTLKADNGNINVPYKKVQDGIDAVVPGGTVYVAAGTYPEDLEVGKSITILGPNADVSPNTGTRLAEAIIAPVDEPTKADPAVLITAPNITVTLKGLTLDMSGSTYTTTNQADRFVELVNKANVTMDVQNNQFLNAPSCVNGNWYITGAIEKFTLTLKDNFFHGSQTSNGISLWGSGPDAHTVDIQNNVWKDNGGYALNINNVTGTIANNQILDTVGTGPESINEQFGILFENYHNVTLTGNTFDGMTNMSILLYPQFNGSLVATQNIFKNTTNEARGVIRIWDGANLTGVKFEKNHFLNNPIGVQNLNTYAGAVPLDVSPNWWGTAAGPAAGVFEGDATYIPWCTNPGCTEFGAPVHNSTKGTYHATIQAGIDGAENGNVIEVAPGTYNEDLTIDKAITLQGPGFVETFDDPIDLTEWYVDRKAPGVFKSGTFQGENVLHHGIRAVDLSATPHQNSQGRKYDINLSGPNQIVSIDLFVGEDWDVEGKAVGMWITGFNANDIVSSYPIVAFRHTTTEAAGFYGYDVHSGAWILLRAAEASDYGKWHTMEIELTAGVGLKYYIDGEMLLDFAHTTTAKFGNVILNASNFGADYDIYWDNFGAHDARINGEINISAGNVNLNGLMLSNPGDTQAVVIHSTAAGVNLSENLILEVGGKAYNQKVQAVNLQGGPNQVKFEDNLFTRIHASDKSANGIFSGDTLSTDPAEGLIIKNNRFVNITSGTRGAYGILLNNKEGNPNAVIEGNLFSAVAGGWTHAIGMEGPTPGAKIEKNIFNELTYGDAHAAIFFEANPDYGTTQIIYNQFLSTDYFSVAVHPSMDDVAPIIVARNWWGKTSGPEFPLQLDDPINFGFSPWCLNAECTLFSAEPKVGFELDEVAGACSITEQTIEIKATDLANLTAFTMAFDYNQNLVEIVKVENVTGMPGVVAADVDNTVDGKYLFDFYRQGGSPISGNASLIKITYKSKQLAGDAEFTLDTAKSMLVQWPEVNPMPVTVSNATTKVTYPLVATNTSRTPNVGYCTLPAAIEAAASGETVRAEVSVAIPPQIIEKELTLNTNGMTISRDPAFTVGNNFFTVKNGGKLTLTGAGTISTTISTAVLVEGSLGNETVLTNNDVNIIGPYFSVAVNANRTPGGTEIYPAKYIMLGGKTQDSVIAQGKGAELDLSGGKMYGVPPVMGNGTVDADYDNSGTIIRVSGTVEIFGSTVNPLASGIYHPQYGDLYISGGTIEGYNGVEMKAGNLTMTGGKIQGVGAYVESPDYTGNGSTKAGDGLFVYSRNGYSTNNLMNINISGGEISSTNAYAIREFNHSDEANRIDKFSISGGTFLGNAGLEAVLFKVADPDQDKLALTDGAYSSDPVVYVYSPLATYLDTDGLYRITAQPTITADPFAAYYLTVDENAFKATLTNPAGAASYAHAMVKLTIPGATPDDLDNIEFLEPAGLASITWKQVGDDLVGWYGGVAIGGVPLPAGASVDRDITIQFNAAGVYTLKGELYQMDGTIVTDGDYSGHAISKLTEASFRVTVYDKPVITTDLVGPYHAGEAANVIINVNDVDAIFTPDKTELHLDLPEGTIVVYNGVEYTCTATGCVIPVTLAAGNNALALTITFPGAFEGTIGIGLFDKTVIPGKQLATFETPAVVSVYGNVGTFTGMVSMQGQLTNRKDVPMTLTGPTDFGFGPYNATSDSRGKLTFSNLPVGSYFVSTNQARYLNLYIGTDPAEQWIANLSTLTSLPDLKLFGGNAVWDDNVVNDQDSGLVASGYMNGVDGVYADADVNFDGRANIQDLALVGGNYLLDSATAYSQWLR